MNVIRIALLTLAVTVSQVLSAANAPTTVMYHETLSSKNQPKDIVIPEGVAIYKADGLSVTKPGELVKLDRYYSLAERTVRYVARFSEDAVALFTSDSKDYTAFVDMPRQKFGIKLPIGFRNYTNREVTATLDPTHEYLVEITRYYSTMTAVLNDLYTGEESRIEVTNDGAGGAGPGSINTGTRVGLLHDYYCFGLDSGSEMVVSDMTVTARQCDYTLLIYGDSITEPDD